MGTQNWIVKNGGGIEWGLIKRLVLNSDTRQINFADVFVIHTGHIARIPWNNFEIGNEGITLGISEAQVTASVSPASDTPSGDVVAMDVWP